MGKMDEKAKEFLSKEFMKFCNKEGGWKFIDVDTGEEIKVEGTEDAI